MNWYFKYIVIFCTFAIFYELNAQVIISNTNNPVASLSKATLRNIFLGNTTTWETNQFIKIADYISELKIRKDFSYNYLDLTPQKVSMIWIKVSLSGKAVPPKIFRDEDEMKQFISENENAIGYISSSQNLPPKLKVILIR